MSEQKTNNSSWSNIKNSKKAPLFLGFGFLLILVLVFAGIVLFTRGGSDTKDKGRVVFTIENQDFYENELRDIVKYPVEKSGFNEEGAFRSAFDVYKVIVVAKNAGIIIEDRDVNKILSETVPESVSSDPEYEVKYKPWFELLATRDAINNQIGSESSTGHSGYAYVFYFGQHIESGDDYKPEGLNDPGLIAQDRAYSKEKAEYYYSQISDNKITPEQAGAEIKADKRLNNIISVKNPFGKSSDSTWEDDVFYLSVKNYITKANHSGLSELLVGQGYPSANFKASDSTVDLYYYFVVLDDNPQVKSISMSEFDKLLADAKTTGFDNSAPIDDGRVELTEEDKRPKTDAELGIEGIKNVTNQ